MAGGHLYETPISSSQKIKLSKEGYIIVEEDNYEKEQKN